MDWHKTEIGPAVAADLRSCSCSSCLQLLHSLKVVRIVDDALDDGSLLIREGSVAQRAVHLIAAAHLGNCRTAAGARPAVLNDLGNCGDQCRITHVLHAFGFVFFTFAASTAELGRTGSALVGRTQESAAGFRRTGRHKEALLFGFFGVGFSFRTIVDVVLVAALLGLDIAQHRPQLVFLCVERRNLGGIGPLLDLNLHIRLCGR